MAQTSTTSPSCSKAADDSCCEAMKRRNRLARWFVVLSFQALVTVSQQCTLTQLELMRRKQSMQHFDQRQQLVLENAYYQV